MTILCPVCEAGFSDKNSVNQHLGDEHHGEFFTDTVSGLSLSCRCDNPVCSKPFDRVASQIDQRQYCSQDCFNHDRYTRDVA